MNRVISYLKRSIFSVGKQFKTSIPFMIAVVLVLLLVLLWWLGPEWQFGESRPFEPLSSRIAATIVLLIVPLFLWTLSVRKKYQELEGERKYQKAIELDPCIPYVQAQDRHLNENFATLKANSLSNDFLYKLPWYLVLGQENSGKTSLVNRSNQNFTLTNVMKAGTVQSLKDPFLAYPIDWWIGNEAVLIDPPGEIISQAAAQAYLLEKNRENDDLEESAEDQESTPNEGGGGLPDELSSRLWAGLVDWLGHKRSDRPLNGIILTVDFPLLLNQTPSERKAMAALLRARLFEVSQQLGIRFPIYIVLTKFDLLEGFDEFFNQLPRNVREDVLGFSFTLESIDRFDAWLEEFSKEYDALVNRLKEQIFDEVGRSHTLKERESLYSFVAQLAGVRNILVSYFTEILGSDNYSTPALVRGVYFSSVYQEGLLSNAFVKESSKTYRVASSIPKAKEHKQGAVYFTGKLFTDIIYPEAGLAGDNIRVLKQKRHILYANTAVAAAVCVLALGGWQYFYITNKDKVINLDNAVRNYHAGSSGVDIGNGQEGSKHIDVTGKALLPSLNGIRDAVSIYENYREAWPVVEHMGLYQGRTVGPKVDEAYIYLLSDHFLKALSLWTIDNLDASLKALTQLNALSEQKKNCETALGNKATQDSCMLLNSNPFKDLSESQLRDQKLSLNNRLLSALRVYQMMQSLENRRPKIVEYWMLREWQNKYPHDGLTQDQLMSHLEYAMLYAQSNMPEYKTKINEIQAILKKEMTPQERVYIAMKSNSRHVLGAPLDLRNKINYFDMVFQVVDSVKPIDYKTGNSIKEDAATENLLFEKPSDAVYDSILQPLQIDVLFTSNGFRSYFTPQSKEVADLAMVDEWVLGETQSIRYSEKDINVMRERINTLYVTDYINTWARALKQFEVVDFKDIQHGVTVLETVTGSSEPFRSLIVAVKENSEVYPTLISAQATGQAQTPTATGVAAIIEASKPATPRNPIPEASKESLEVESLRITRTYSPLSSMLEPDAGKASTYEDLMKVVSELHDYMKQVQDSPDRGKVALQLVMDRFELKGADPISNLERMAAGLPDPMRRHAAKLALESERVLMMEALKELDKRWQMEVYNFYSERLATRYPFNPSSRNDVSLEDFDRFFGPRGILNEFTSKYVNVFMKENTSRAASKNQEGYTIRTDLMERFKAANQISEAFFNSQGALNMQFTLQPLGMTSNTRSSLLNIDGQLIAYRHGPAATVGLIWPNTFNESVVSKITFVNSSGSSSEIAARGPWSFFRLLSQAKEDGERSSTSIGLRFAVGQNGISYRLSSEKMNNPFTNRLFDGFRLPSTLLSDVSTVQGQKD